MNILGVSAFYHDSAACLVQHGKIIAAAQEERFSRKKHDAALPRAAVDYCLRAGGVAIRDVDVVAFYEKPFRKFDRILHTYLAFAPLGLRSFLKAIPLWIKDRIWMKDTLRRELGFDGRMIFTEHHESHAASAFFPSPYPESAFLTIDGVGEWTTTSFGRGSGNRIRIEGELRFPHSLGLLYSAFTYFTGFKVNSGEYKLMGLAPYGEPRYVDVILQELIDLKADGSFRLNQEYFSYCTGLTMTNRRFARLFDGPPRRHESRITQRDMDLARSIQEVTGEIMLRMARHVRRMTGLPNLCLAGGVALNCVANGRILRESIFENLWIQPAAGDAGGALGAALFAWYQFLGNERPADGTSDFQQGSLLGPGYDPQTIRALLEAEHVAFTELSDEETPGRIAELIRAEKVVGWFQGRMEFGPRALGARSIIADARSPRMQEVMNLKIKFRESFRPFAPAILRERVADFFELDRDSPYMLIVAPVAKKHRIPEEPSIGGLSVLQRLLKVRSTIPAVTHVDGSARVQTVTGDTHPLLYRMIRELDRLAGCPVVINTSFNVRGEPIVCTPGDALQCFRRTNMDYLLLGNFLIEQREHKPPDKDLDWLREFELD